MNPADEIVAIVDDQNRDVGASNLLAFPTGVSWGWRSPHPLGTFVREHACQQPKTI